MMRGMSVNKDEIQRKKFSQKQSVASNELGSNHGKQQFDIGQEEDDMHVEQFSYASQG